MSKATKVTMCYICHEMIQLGEDVSWARRGMSRTWHTWHKDKKESLPEAKESGTRGSIKLLVKDIPGLTGPRELSISKTKNFEGKECLKAHKIMRNEPFIRISNSFGASDSLMCLEHSREKGWIK